MTTHRTLPSTFLAMENQLNQIPKHVSYDAQTLKVVATFPSGQMRNPVIFQALMLRKFLINGGLFQDPKNVMNVSLLVIQSQFYSIIRCLCEAQYVKKSYTNSLTTIVRGDTCNCDGKPGHSNWIFEHKSDFPDYESCRKKCIGTEGCHYFGIWTSINKGYCRLWKKCETCNEALYPNKVYQLSRGIKLILL